MGAADRAEEFRHDLEVQEVAINPGPTPVDADAPFAGTASAEASIAARLVLYDVNDLLDGRSGLTFGQLAWRAADQTAARNLRGSNHPQ